MRNQKLIETKLQQAERRIKENQKKIDNLNRYKNYYQDFIDNFETEDDYAAYYGLSIRTARYRIKLGKFIYTQQHRTDAT